MLRPIPTPVYHFTHVNHLESIVRNGLLADSRAQGNGLLAVEIGNVGIKAQRQRRTVPAAPGGVVSDYVPFYFAPRSPMMFAIHKGGVSTYTAGCDDLVYLVTTADQLCAARLTVLFTDRNAALDLATYCSTLADLDTLVDWPLMVARYWANTDADPDRRERRMAECLVHDRVPWAGFQRIVAKNRVTAGQARDVVDRLGVQTPVVVVPDWYF